MICRPGLRPSPERTPGANTAGAPTARSSSAGGRWRPSWMAVYVDDMNLQADVPDGRRAVRARWNHLFADTEEELRAFAAKIELKAEWIQDPGGRHAHFDVTAGKRQQAIADSAKAVTWREAGEFFSRQAFAWQRERKAQREAKPVRHSWAAVGNPPAHVKILLQHRRPPPS